MRSKVIQFENYDTALVALQAKDKGRYFICNCPICKRAEAFIYKNNKHYVHCNHANSCGEITRLSFVKQQEASGLEILVAYEKLTKEQCQQLEKVTLLIDCMRLSMVSIHLDNGYRGIRRAVTEPFIADMGARGTKAIFSFGSKLFTRDYTKIPMMCERNIIIAIYDKQHMVERILLRSSNKKFMPKEIQLVVNPSKKTRDFFIDIPQYSHTIVVTEALLDALSFREIDNEIGIIALTGAKKAANVLSYIKKHHILDGYHVLLAFDNDRAGNLVLNQFKYALTKQHKSYHIFDYPKAYGDANEMLVANRQQFIERYATYQKFWQQELEEMHEVDR